VRSGRESEIGQLNRPIIDRGRARGIGTPTHEVVDGLIEALDGAVCGLGGGGFGGQTAATGAVIAAAR
jgi:hypothetical protein